jgi:conjugative transfer signal peptidase TraF
MNRGYLHVAATAVTLLSLSAWFAPAPRLLWNASQSAPVGLYRIDPGAAPMVGDWVAIEPPAELAAYMARRKYLPRGVPLLKRVAALPGARVCRSGVFVTVDGRAVARALARDGAGRPLPVWLGCRIVQAREIFLVNAARDSLDGRYFGPLPTTGLLGTAHPILTRDAPGTPLRWRPSGRDLAFPRSEME